MSDNTTRQLYAGPGWAWETIWETIAMDERAGNFDPALRREISEARLAIDRYSCGRCFEDLPKIDAATLGLDRTYDVGAFYAHNGETISIQRNVPYWELGAVWGCMALVAAAFDDDPVEIVCREHEPED